MKNIFKNRYLTGLLAVIIGSTPIVSSVYADNEVVSYFEVPNEVFSKLSNQGTILSLLAIYPGYRALKSLFRAFNTVTPVKQNDGSKKSVKPGWETFMAVGETVIAASLCWVTLNAAHKVFKVTK